MGAHNARQPDKTIKQVRILALLVAVLTSSKRRDDYTVGVEPMRDDPAGGE